MLTRKRIHVIALALCLVISLSCELLTSGANGAEDGFFFHWQSLKAILKLPEPYDKTKQYTLLVALHGNGGTAASLAPAFSSFSKESLMVAVPEGQYPKPSGGFSWFYETSDRSLWESYDTRSVESVLGLISEIRARYPVGKVFILGFSQGASLAYMIGLRNPSLVTGILAIGGAMPEIDQKGSIIHAQDVADAQRVKIFIAHGVSDDLVTKQTYTAQRDFFLSQGYSVTAQEYVGGHYLTTQLLGGVLQWVKKNAGE